MAMDALRCPPGDADVTKLSGGEKPPRGAVPLLLSKPDMLLLDEPTNHLDAEIGAWLEKHLIELPRHRRRVTHDRYFLDNVTGWILELDRGEGIPLRGQLLRPGWSRRPSAWSRKARGSRAPEDAAARARMGRSLAQGPPGQEQGAPRAYEELAEAGAEREKIRPAQIVIPPGPRLGNDVIEAEGPLEGLRRQAADRQPDLQAAAGRHRRRHRPERRRQDHAVPHDHRPEKPDAGTIKVGDTVKLGYVDQSPRRARRQQDGLGGDLRRPRDIILSRQARDPLRAYCGAFNFKGGDQQKKVGQLSGGERNRVHLAKMLKSGGNVLLLDEPTNDLDVDTLRALEDALEDFAGCAVVIISHDRWFLDRIATHILAFEGDSHVEWFEGNFQDYEADKKRRLGDRRGAGARSKR
jgi:ATPase subunit of ABC transporter with duplicated ATPase domains